MISETTFASRSVTRHVVRGVIGLGLLVAAFGLVDVISPLSLLLAIPAVVALRGCPTCWAYGLSQTIAARRIATTCADGRCAKP